MDQSSDLRAWGKALHELRKAKGLTQMDICRETGAAPAAVYRWEAGKVRPQARFFRKLRELFPELPELPRTGDEGAAATAADDRPSDAA